MYGLLIAMLVSLSAFLWIAQWLYQQMRSENLWKSSLLGVFGGDQKPRKLREQFENDLKRYAEFMGKPTLAIHVYRLCFTLPLIWCGFMVLLGFWYAAVLGLFLFFAPYVWLYDKYKTAKLDMKGQLRITKLVLAYLLRAGAPVDRALIATTGITQYPLKPYLEDVCAVIGRGEENEIKADTVAGAFRKMAERVQMPEMSQFAQQLTQASKYNIPLAKTLLQSLEVENKIRAANAEEVYGMAESKITIYMSLFLALPTFGFLFFAAFSLFLKVLGGSGIGFGF